MYRALLRANWKTLAPLVLLLAGVAFALPIGQVVLTGVIGSMGRPDEVLEILSRQAVLDAGFPLIAYISGALLGASIWNDDFIGKHIYALSLPVPRWYYLLLRLSVAQTFVLVLGAGLWLAGLIAASQVTLPEGLHAYPTGLAVRFTLACAIGTTSTFAIGSASPRVLRIGVWVIVAAFAVSVGFAMADRVGPIERIVNALLQWPSVADAFTGRWRLIDV